MVPEMSQCISDCVAKYEPNHHFHGLSCTDVVQQGMFRFVGLDGNSMWEGRCRQVMYSKELD